MHSLAIAHQTGDRFEIQVRGHRLVCDQPVADGGSDQGPTPTELFIGSLAACVAFYARRFLARHDLDPDGLRVDADFTMSPDRPARVDTIALRLGIPKSLAPNRRRALLSVVNHCTVHNSIRTPPEIRVELAEAADAGANSLPTPDPAAVRMTLEARDATG